MADASPLLPHQDPSFERPAASSGYSGAFGLMLQKLGDRSGVFAFQVEERHLNQNGVCHGGAMMTFADIALGRAGRTTLRPGEDSAVTISLNVDFVAAAKPGEWVVATVGVLRRTKRLIFTQATMAVCEKVVASARGIFAIRD